VLLESGYGERVLIAELEILELYEDRAIQAVRALRAVARDPLLAPHLAPDPELKTLDGGRRRAYFEESRDWAQRLQITEQEDGALRFAVLTDRARAEATLQTTQRELIDALVGEVVAGTAERESITVTLFELLIPNRLKEAAPDSRDMVLVVDKGSARYPWELLRDRLSPGDEPMAVRAAMVRQLYTDRFRERVAMTHLRSALVVGDPPSRFPPLPGARAEAEQAAKRLESAGFVVRRSIGKDHRHVLNALYARDYRLLHLAAHGVYEYEPPGQAPGAGRRVTGMVLGDNVFLTPAEIEQMRVVPELVFINCCFLGRIAEPMLRRERGGLAANLATQLIEMGVRVVVAAGWEVDDAAAALFAETFYGQLLSGRPFGQALREARRRVWTDFPNINTWGAYQGYGDPDFCLAAGAAAVGGGEPRFDYVAPAEVVADLENIRADAKTADPTEAAVLLQRVRTIAAQLPASWRNEASLLVSLGDATGELGAFADAVAHYRRALEVDGGGVPLAALDSLCNIQVRWGRELAASGKAADRQRAAEEMDDARARLERLLELAPSAERWSLLGGTWLRRAALLEAGERWDALSRAAQNYDSAARRAASAGDIAGLYARGNALTARILLLLLGRERDSVAVKALEGELTGLAAEAAAQRANQPDFWSEIGPLDCDVLGGLLAGNLDERADAITEGYRVADRSFGSPREMRSVVDRLTLMAEILSVKPAQRGLQKLVRGLRKIVTATDAAR
jgi:tetratricopeptide (TPR) repeat protein